MTLRIAGLLGGLLIVAAAFVPAVTIAFNGTRSVFAISPGIAVLLALAGGMIGAFAWLGNAKGQLSSLLGAAAMSILAFYVTMIEIGLAASKLESQIRQAGAASGVDFRNPPIDMMMTDTRLEWSWYLLVSGLLISLVTALIALRAKRA